jgi:hypothetical protein
MLLMPGLAGALSVDLVSALRVGASDASEYRNVSGGDWCRLLSLFCL